MHLVHVVRSPIYLSELVTATSELPSRRNLRSACSQQCEVPQTSLKFGVRSFSFDEPTAWNTLTLELTTNQTLTFLKSIKNYLFFR